MNKLEFQQQENCVDARVGDGVGVVWVPEKAVLDLLIADSSTCDKLKKASVVSKRFI